jgi:uncharacterized protein YjiS (DUF1127 family)
MTYQGRQERFANNITSVTRESELEHYIAKGRLLRAQAFAALLTVGAARIVRLLHSGFSAGIKLGQRATTWLAREHQRRAGLRALMALDDHLLKDIGLSRSEVHAMVNGVFRSPEAGQSPERAEPLTLVVNKKAVSNDNVRRAA